MQQEEKLTPQESLVLIQSMIRSTRNNIGENRFYFLLWGWVTFLASLMQFILKVLVNYPHHYIVWLAVLPAAVITMVHAARQSRRETVKTYIGEGMSYLWTGIGISFFVLSFIISNLRGGWINAYPFFILFYGLGTFVSGRLLQFRPLVIGGIVNWVLAIVSVFVPYDYQILMASAALLISYIIPGHLLKANS